MAKISRAPNNFYTAQQAAKKLGMKESTFHYHVRNGKIKKVVPPGGTEGYYPKTIIDRMVLERELFILEYASEPSMFAVASDEDIQGIYEIGVSLFGTTNATSYSLLMDWHKKNPETYYVVKQEGIVTGYLGLLYLDDATTRYIMTETTHSTPKPPATNVLPFTPHQAIEGLFVGIGVRPGLASKQSRYYGRHLITGCMDVIEVLAKRGMPVRKLYATSATTDGIKLCRELGFEEHRFLDDPLIRFELNLETSDNPLAQQYQSLVERHLKNNAIDVN